MLFRMYCGCCEMKPAAPSGKTLLDELDDGKFELNSPMYRYEISQPMRGKFIIINNKTFSTRGLNDRLGTDVDADNLETDFKRLGFDVQRHDDKKAFEMLQLVVTGNLCSIVKPILVGVVR
jgi:phenylalanyl-tRNA synthetase beta subunit